MKKKRIDELLRVISHLTKWEAPTGLLQGISEEVGCTREYVRQRASTMKFFMRRAKVRKFKKTCRYCDKKFAPIRPDTRYCSIKCRNLVNFYKHFTIKICEECHLGFINPTSRCHARQHYCSKRCQGRHLGKTWGNGGRKHKTNAQV